MKILKPLAGVLGVTLALAGLAFQPVAPAAAEEGGTNIPITVSADAYATDDSGQITSDSEFLWDSAKSDEPENAYKLAYRGTLGMKSLWSNYNTMRFLWLLRNGNDVARWQEKTFSGQWTISFQVDTSVVSATSEFATCDVLQNEIIKQNPGTQLGAFIRCSTVTYDATSGVYSADFTLIHADGGKVTGADLDGEYKNKSAENLRLTTPPQAFYVAQSRFEAGKEFTMTSPSVIGEMRMDAFYTGMPLRFNATGNAVTLKMVTTYDATYSFVSATTGRELPAEVLALAPPPTTMLREGAEVTPAPPSQTEVAADQGIWSFVGWEPATQTIVDRNVAFVGSWQFTVDPNAQFLVEHRFEASQLARSAAPALPAEVLALVPESYTATQGTEVSPGALEATSVSDKAGTWTFAGWSPSTAVVDGSNVTFTGSWTYKAAEYTVEHSFRAAPGAGESSLKLPTEVLAFLPESFTALHGAEVTPSELGTADVTVTDGSWKFAGWQPSAATVDGGDVMFVGEWTFTAGQKATPPNSLPTTGSSMLLASGIATFVLAMSGSVLLYWAKRRRRS